MPDGNTHFIGFLRRNSLLLSVMALIIMASLVRVQHSVLPEIFSLAYNPYGVISAISGLGATVLFFILLRSKSQAEESQWFALLLVVSIVFDFFEAMQRFNVTQSGSLFWIFMTGVVVTMGPTAIYLFAATYTKPANLRLTLVAPILIVTTLVIGGFYAGTSIVFDINPANNQLYPWGYDNPPGAGLIIVLAWDTVLFISALALLLRYRHGSHNPLLRRQALIYAIAITAPIAGGVAVDGILPLLHITNVPTMSGVFELLADVIILYGFRQYHLFQINPAVISESILSTMSEAVIVAREDLRVEYANPEAQKLLSTARGSLVEQNIEDLFDAPSWDKVWASLVTPGAKADLSGLHVRGISGQLVPVRVLASKLSQSTEYTAYIFVLSDITNLTMLLERAKELQRRLRKEKASVEHTVEVRTAELQQAQARLKAADQMKTEFIMISSHNLRTPLSVMEGSLDLMRRDITPEHQLTVMEALQRSVKQLHNFVEDMVTITSLESGAEIPLQPVPFREVIQPLIAEGSALAASKKLTWVAEIPDTDAVVMANTQRLQGAIRNLITNASKFTATGMLKLSVIADSHKIMIKMTDTGIGIAPDELTKLFTKFHRGTDTLRYEYEGEGIGLYLTKLIVEEHGGEITAESRLGKGSTFTIVVPIVKAPSHPKE